MMSTYAETAREQDLIAGFQAGDPASFRQLYDQFGHQLEIYVRTRCPRDADDVIQQTWLKVWNSRQTFAGSRIGAWIITIARNTLYDHFRKPKSYPLTEQSHGIAEQAAASFRLEREEELSQLRECSEQLPDVIRRIVQAFFSGTSGENIAAAEDIQRSTVYTRVHRALANLRKCMEQKRI